MTSLLMILLSAALLAALLWLLFGRKKPKRNLSAAALEIKKLLPVHCRYFPPIQQILKTEDWEFMMRRAPRHVMSRWHAERRRILRLYISGLRQDFRGLDQLARLIATLSPEIQRKQEWECLWLGVQFRVLYRMTQLRFALHRLPPSELARLTELLTSLAMALEHSIDRMTEAFPQAQPTSG